MQLTNEQTEYILTGCIRNERKAQKELYTHYYGYAMAIALRYSTSHENAVEMVNDGFLKIYRDLKNFAPRFESTAASFTAWLRKVIINACIDHLRKYNHKEIKSNAEPENIVLADERQSAEQMLQHKEVMNCIQQLSPAYKAVFNMYVIEGFSHAEIATLLGISESTSKSNLFKSRQKLRELLKKSNVIKYERVL